MRDIIDKLVGRFGAGPEPAATPGLTEADRRAIRDDLALFTPLDAELATGLARYVLSGTDESALLRLKAVPIQEALRAYFGHQWRDAEVRNRQRAAVFLKLQGWDAAAIKRCTGTCGGASSEAPPRNAALATVAVGPRPHGGQRSQPVPRRRNSRTAGRAPGRFSLARIAPP
jgi:hypothetical protein